MFGMKKKEKETDEIQLGAELYLRHLKESKEVLSKLDIFSERPIDAEVELQ